MDEATQPATQQILDPRRVGGNNSGLDGKDIADVLAILHPGSPSAIKIVEDTADTRRHHVLLRNSYDSFDDNFGDIEEQETIIINRSETHNYRVGADLALRMSSVGSMANPSLGYIFGRNPSISDIVFGQDASKRISNQHFRIYLNSDAILMIEDMSTNGTIVDDVLLKNRDPRFNKVRMLDSGSIICIPHGGDGAVIKFIVRVPSRVSHMDRFSRNLREFLVHCLPEADKAKALQRLDKQYSGPTMKWDGGERYNIIGLLGKGAFATVHKLATKMEGKVLAAKELEKRRFMKNGLLDKKIDNEMQIMQYLRHPNIVEFVEYHDQGDYLYIIMEYVRHGDLQLYLNKTGPMPEIQAKSMARQMLSALSYLHRMKVTHRDIKPDNILISDLDPFTIKISDFGLSKVVKHDETFLKTFCGTLLYCAPEVFPDFDGAPSKGTKRRRGAKQQFHSYGSSVDIWSFAAVLWFALCGKPPFEGIADATGRAMYTNIMNTRLDPTPLVHAGVSDSGINLLREMLQTDPALRPSPRHCLQHPWLKDDAALPVDPVLQSIVEEDEYQEAGEHLSQLSIGAVITESDDDPEDDILEDDVSEDDVLEDEEFGQLLNDRQSKKIRMDPVFPRNQLRECDPASSVHQSFHSQHDADEQESFRLIEIPSGRARLFGEIGQSALQSSGILDVHANEALSHQTSNGAQEPQAQLRDGQHRQESPTLQGVPRLDGVFSSPSLLGAESLVRELNVASPHSPMSSAQSLAEPTTPKTPEMSQHNSLGHSSKHESQISEPTPRANPPTLNRQISLPKTPSFFYDPYDPSTHTLEYASKISGIDFVSTARAAKFNVSELDNTMRLSTEKEHSSEGEESSTSGADLALPPVLDTKTPPRRLGKLTATSDSFTSSLVLTIDQSRVSWGRAPRNTVVYEDPNDTRIPKTAFNIFWWSSSGDISGSVRDLSQQGKDWTTLDNLHVGIFTCASSGISVNGKHLRMKDDKGQALFGFLHSGDIIQVYHNSRTRQCLKFKCEFYHGTGKELRPSGQNFWALPAFLRIALASQHTFSVFDDILAFPQYEVVFPNTYIGENDATSLLSHSASHSPSSATAKAQETQELSKPGKQTSGSTPSDAILEETYEAVVLGGQRYLCSIPVIPEEAPQNSTATAEQVKAEEEKELIRAADRGWELLDGMQGECIYYLSGWWSYSFCYKDDVKQFHQLPPSRGVPIYPPVEDTSVKSYVLGSFSGEKGKKKGAKAQKTLGREEGSTEEVVDDEGKTQSKGLELAKLETKGSTRYMVQKLSGGTECDLTGKERKIEVQFHCHPSSADRISMIKEIATCSYLMIIYTPRLCNDVAFQPPQENLAYAVSCQPVIPESEVEAYASQRIVDRITETERLSALEDSNPLREMAEGAEGTVRRGPIIGGIEVGAQMLVGSEGKVIERGVVVGGGKETFVGTVASSDGTTISVAEMKKLNIKDPKDVEKLKKNVQNLAGRKGWKLDLVDTPRGREFRAIIEADEEVPKEKDGKTPKEKDGKTPKEKDGKTPKEKDGKTPKEKDGKTPKEKDGKTAGKKDTGDSGSDDKGRGMKREEGTEGKEAQDGEKSEEGSEEVFKDEL
ncbi:hypothetical protein K504DRAFT_470107 [Pleomassaria siparia CBS 279.74]|uniref:Uncharacterized protein n=1 Tax=Pleomassaria siparia CBS 279.74 TaxID=1314801 RepID=A0A6G1K4C7_9PLEO|nr:hypothetical protein K504DRAFT_470107 [Pleomassaria siparia CBS 279.74]